MVKLLIQFSRDSGDSNHVWARLIDGPTWVQPAWRILRKRLWPLAMNALFSRKRQLSAQRKKTSIVYPVFLGSTNNYNAIKPLEIRLCMNLRRVLEARSSWSDACVHTEGQYTAGGMMAVSARRLRFPLPLLSQLDGFSRSHFPGEDWDSPDQRQ